MSELGLACPECGRAMVNRERDLPELTRLLGVPPKAPPDFCVVHGPWPDDPAPGLPHSIGVGSVAGSPHGPHAYNVELAPTMPCPECGNDIMHALGCSRA